MRYLLAQLRISTRDIAKNCFLPICLAAANALCRLLGLTADLASGHFKINRGALGRITLLTAIAMLLAPAGRE